MVMTWVEWEVVRWVAWVEWEAVRWAEWEVAATLVKAACKASPVASFM